MFRLLALVFFLALATALLGGVHYYLYRRLVRDPALSPRLTRILRRLLLSAGILLPTAMILGRVDLLPFRAVLVWPAFLWLGLMFLLFSLLVLSEPLRAGYHALRRAVAPERLAARRVFLARALALTVVVGAATLGGLGVNRALRAPRLHKVRVPLARLPAPFAGMTVAQISDLHVGQTVRRDYVAAVVDRINAQAPDAVVITGDLVDGSVAELAPHVAPLAGLRSKFGTFFVTGNHEFYSGVQPWVAHLRSLGIRVLRNERATLERDGAVIDLLGVDDSGKRHPAMAPGEGADVARAMAGADPSRLKILLAHRPIEIDAASQFGIDLQLSGHTHGGQLWPWGYLVRLNQPYLSGLHRHDGRTWIYVSSGTGYWGPPMRIGTDSEITLLELVTPDPSPAAPVALR
jgi:predicted MPP superfamily phosphohydrolase